MDVQYSLEIWAEDGSSAAETIPSDSLSNVEFSRTHSGIGTWNLQVHDSSIPIFNYKYYRVVLKDTATSDVLFEGVIENIEKEEKNNVVRVGGRGKGQILTDDYTERTFSNVSAHSAIETYINEETNFSANVTTPTGRQTVTGQTHTSEDQSTFNKDDIIGEVFTTASDLPFKELPFIVETERATDTIDASGGSQEVTLDVSKSQSIDLTLTGASGEDGGQDDDGQYYNGKGGNGGKMTGTLDVSNESEITLGVDNFGGSGGFGDFGNPDGGAGGGDAYVKLSDNTVVAVAGGGGGGGGAYEDNDVEDSGGGGGGNNEGLGGAAPGAEDGFDGEVREIPDWAGGDGGDAGQSGTDPATDGTDGTAVYRSGYWSNVTVSTEDNANAYITGPIGTESVYLRLAQAAFTSEAENASPSGSGWTTITDSGFSGGEAIEMTATGDTLTYSFTPEYEIPRERIGIAIRVSNEVSTGGSVRPHEVRLDGTKVRDKSSVPYRDPVKYHFRKVNDLPRLKPNTQYTLDLEVTGTSGDPLVVDYLVVYDTAWYPEPYRWFEVGSNETYAREPPLYPRAEHADVVRNFVNVIQNPKSAGWNVTEATLTTSFEDNDGNSTTPENVGLGLAETGTINYSSGTSSTTETFSAYGQKLQGAFELRGMPRYANPEDTQFPSTGFRYQRLLSFDITFDGNDIGVIDDLTLEGTHLENIQRLAEEGDMRFVIPHQAFQGSNTSDEGTIDVFRHNDLSATSPGITATDRRVRFDGRDYANSVTVRGAKQDDGTRLSQHQKDSTEISTYGRVHYDKTDPSLESQEEVDNQARQILASRVTNDEKTGVIEFVPQALEPGKPYSVTLDEADGSVTVPNEEVRFIERAGQLRGQLEFDLSERLVQEISGLKSDSRNTKQRL